MISIRDISSINRDCARALEESDVRTTAQLLERGATSFGRMRLADETHLSDEQVKAWVHLADLLRVNGMNQRLAELLCRIGVCTVPKLAYADIIGLYRVMSEHVHNHHLMFDMPSVTKLENLIRQAKTLPKMIRH